MGNLFSATFPQLLYSLCNLSVWSVLFLSPWTKLMNRFYGSQLEQEIGLVAASISINDSASEEACNC